VVIVIYCFSRKVPVPQVIQTEHAASQGKDNQKHVMISYNWGHQHIVKKISQALQQSGYRVWLDVEQMKGSTLEASKILYFHLNLNLIYAVADAIERADMVLMCMSQKYKDSPNCRLEGEYCVNQRIPFIPLMMQNGYHPDGW
jgi:hypothetical protein